LIIITFLRQENYVGKPLKIILSTLTTVLLLLVAAACILPFVINPDDFKPEIVKIVKEKTGQELVLEGDLKLSVLPWLGISTGKMSLNNAPDFQNQPFASIEESDINVLLLPLFSKKIEVSRIVLKGLVLNLTKNKQGIANWSALTQSADTKIVAPETITTSKQNQQPALAVFAVGGIAIENARINWDDANTGQHIEIKDLRLNTDKVTFNEPAGIAGSFSALTSKTAFSHNIKFNTELTVTQTLDIFTLRQSNLQITSTGENIPGNPLTTNLSASNIMLDMAQQTAKISGLQLQSADVLLSAELTGTAIKDNPAFQGPVSIASFSPVKLMQQLSIKLPVMQDPGSLSKLAINFDLAATADSVELQKLIMSLDESQIEGFVSMKDFSQPAFRFVLDIDTLDVDRYLAPAKKSSKPVVTPAVLLAAGFSIVPVERLRTFNSDGEISLGKLKVNGLAMQDVHVNLNTKNGLVSVQQSIKQFYQGNYTGDLKMDAKGDKILLAMNEQISQLQLEPLLKDYKSPVQMSGMVNLSAQLEGQGRKADELKSTLNGKLNFLVKDAVLKGFNLQKIIDQGKALIKGAPLPTDPKNDQTLFSEMSGTATITNGLIQNNDLVAKSPKLHVDGKGNLNLNSDALDYKVDAKLLKAEGTATEPEQLKGSVAINITGTLNKPSYTIDVATLLTDENKAKIEKLIDKLDKKVGPGIGNMLKNFLK
jgi:AsmA protein